MTRFLVKLVKYWYLYLIPLLLIPTAATLYGLKKETIYESTASLINVVKQSFLKTYQANDDNPFATTGAECRRIPMAPLLQSPSVLGRGLRRVHLLERRSLRSYNTMALAQDAAAAVASPGTSP